MNNSSLPRSIIEHFGTLTDPRMERRKEHALQDILVIALCACLCGADSFVNMELFGKSKEEWLKNFLELPNGIPSHDTMSRVFSLLNPQEFGECFARWTAGLRESVGGIVCVDGKTVRRSFDSARSQSAIHMVHAWSQENRLLLGQVKTNEKSNEITAIPELLRSLDLEGCTVTIDAMGCQKNIATEICNADADYVLALKGNHEVLHDEVKTFLEDAQQRNFPDTPHDHFETVEKDHGRIETRKYWITNQIGWMADREKWEGLKTVGMIEATRQINGQTSVERRFYLSSLPADAQRFAQAVRGHWSVENELHWCLDVSFNEDQCRVRRGHAAQNFATLRRIALNILKKDKTTKAGLKGKRLKAGWDHAFLANLLKF